VGGIQLKDHFTIRLYNILRADPINKKIVLCNSFSQGYQWLERACRSLGPVMNTEIHTLESFVKSLVSLTLSERGFTYITGRETFWIVQYILEELSISPNSYISSTMLNPGVVTCFDDALAEIRYAGIKSKELKVEQFETLEKGKFVQQLLSRYEKYLEQHKLVDFPGLLPFIKVKNPHGATFITHEHTDYSAVEREMLEVIAGASLIILVGENSIIGTNSSLSGMEVDFFHATGSLAETREVFRRLAEKQYSWDEVEVIASDYSTYAPAFYTTAIQLGIEATFSKGVGIDFTKVGRSVKLYLDWMESGYNVDYLVKALRQGLIMIHTKDEELSTSRIIREIEKSGIGWGKQRYSRWIKLTKESVSVETENATLVMVRFLESLILALPDDDQITPKIIYKSLNQFLAFAIRLNEQEQQVFQEIQQLEEGLAGIYSNPMNKALAIKYVRKELEQLSTHVTGMPAAGKLHFSSLQDGGQSGRPYTFIIGMNERNWTISGKQDPILLDNERLKISPKLTLSYETSQMNNIERLSRLGMINGGLTCSYSSYDIAENRELNPAYELMQIFRLKTFQPEADYSTLHAHLKEPIGYHSLIKGISLDETDDWMKQIITPNLHIRRAGVQVLSAYPHLTAGQKALSSRADTSISEYDGIVDTKNHEIDYTNTPDAYISVSKLELFGRCPLKFFYQEILGIRPKDVAMFDRSIWLDAMHRGNLFHRIYERYYAEILQKKEQMNQIKHDSQLLKDITEQVISETVEQIPAPSPHVLEKECAGIRKDVQIFLNSELKRTSLPKYLELALHKEDGHFELELSEELTLPIKGYIDRVDETAPSQYKIFDYKTGSPKYYKPNEFFSGGTKLQHALYAVALEQWLKKSGLDPNAEVMESAYFFPTEKGMGEEVPRRQNRREDLAKLTQSMLDAMRHGVFPPTMDPKNCKWCEFAKVCTNHATQMEDKWREETNTQRLLPVMEVNRYV
jgi:ATP-dependent helicase/nuclease subunit B